MGEVALVFFGQLAALALAALLFLAVFGLRRHGVTDALLKAVGFALQNRFANKRRKETHFSFFVLFFVSSMSGGESGNDINYVRLLTLMPFRQHFLRGVLEWPPGRAAFHCDHIAGQLRASCTGERNSHEQKVCDMLHLEHALCWGRQTLPALWDAVRSCYEGKSWADRALCDPQVEQLRAAVQSERSALSVESMRAQFPQHTAAAASCPPLATAASDTEANAALNCLGRRMLPTQSVALAACLRAAASSSEAMAACGETHAELLRTVGLLYGQAKLTQLLELR